MVNREPVQQSTPARGVWSRAVLRGANRGLALFVVRALINFIFTPPYRQTRFVLCTRHLHDLRKPFGE
ncbi:MAG: hypothetical protein ACI915_001979 [Gammaproteobacteria bacterium]|jgi:hypothetical protein